MVELYIPIPDPEGDFLEERRLRSREHAQMRLEILGCVSETLQGLRNGHHISPTIETEILDHVTDFIHNGLQAGTFESPDHCQQAIRKRLLELLAEAKVAEDPWLPPAIQATGVLSGPNSEKQQQRNVALMDAMEAATLHSRIRELVVDLTKQMFAKRAPVDTWNDNGIQEPVVLTVEQMNDLAVNFLFWVLQNDKRFSQTMQFVLYVSIYWKYGEKKIHKVLTGLLSQAKKRKPKGEAKETIPVPDQKTIKALYDEGAQIFVDEGPQLFAKFLEEACVNGQSDKDLIDDHVRISEARTAFHANTASEENNAENLSRVEWKHLYKPETPIEKWLSDIDIILLQHGNLTARNRKFISIIGLIYYFVSNGNVRNVSEKYKNLGAGVREISREIFTPIMERLVLLDPQKSRKSYLVQWIKTLAFKALHRTEQVRIPRYLHNLISFLNRNPDMTDEEVVEYFEARHVGLAAVKRARKLILRKSALSLDHPAFPGDEDERSPQDFLCDTESVGPDEISIQADIRAKTQRLLHLLPPREQIILREHWLHNKSLQEIGDTMLGGVTREAVRQMEERLMCGLQGIERQKRINTHGDESVNYIPPPINTRERFHDAMKADDNYVISVDEPDFTVWCSKEQISPQQEKILRLYLGLSPEIGFRRLETHYIVEYFTGQGEILDLGETKQFLRHVKEKLWETFKDIPEEKRFLKASFRDDVIASAGPLFRELAGQGSRKAWFKQKAPI